MKLHFDATDFWHFKLQHPDKSDGFFITSFPEPGYDMCFNDRPFVINGVFQTDSAFNLVFQGFRRVR
jgi:hypothetical protein